MKIYNIKNGRDIKLKGVAEKVVFEASFPKKVAVKPKDFRGLSPKGIVEIGDIVKVGSPILYDRKNPDIKIVSPASGKIIEINRGDKRVLESIIIETDGKQEAVQHNIFDHSNLKNLERNEIITQLLKSGLWPLIRQRPFSNVADPKVNTKSVFVRALNTDPLALDIDFVLENKKVLFQQGLDILRNLTDGDINLCIHKDACSDSLTKSENVKIHKFFGSHPTGNISTLIHNIDPVKKGEFIWYINALDVLKIANLFVKGQYISEQYVALTGEGIKNPIHVKSINGSSIKDLIIGKEKEGEYRYISGSVLSGTDVAKDGFLGFYDTQITVIPKGGKREFLGWLYPGFNKFSFSKTFASSFNEPKELSLNTDKNGSDRAIVINDVYDSLNTLDILTYFLIKAIVAQDIEEAEQLGILECDEEDFALCTFACPSKTDIGSIIRQGLDLIERES